MACSQTLSGLTRDCLNNIGGILEVMLANADDVSAITITSGKVTAITMAASAKFHRYVLRRGNGAINSTINNDATNGTSVVTNEVLMQFGRMETTKRTEVMAMAQADLIALVKDANGVIWMIGDGEHPLNLSNGAAQTGQASTDRNGYDVTLANESQDLPIEVLTGTGGVDLSTIVA